VSEPKRYQPVVQCVEPSYQAQMIEPKVMEFSEGEYVLHSDYARLKAEVERLTEAVKFNFPGGDQLLADLSKLLTAHRHYCDVNAIDYSKMEKDALNDAKKGGQP